MIFEKYILQTKIHQINSFWNCDENFGKKMRASVARCSQTPPVGACPTGVFWILATATQQLHNPVQNYHLQLFC